MRLRKWALQALRSAKGTSFALVACVAISGCGGSTPVAEKPPANGPAQPAPSGQQADESEQAPEAVVAEFLDGVRRGGTAADVGRLMSTKAREQYAAVGLVMQPIGAPDATFEVTRSVPYGEDGALVNSLWSEKDAEGQPVIYQVGWALRKEAAGWRVSGLILDEDPQPRIFNFENRDDVLALKMMHEEPAAEDSAVTRTAEDPKFEMPPLR